MIPIVRELYINGINILSDDIHLTKINDSYSASREVNTYSRGGRDGRLLGNPFYRGMVLAMELTLSPHCSGKRLLEIRDNLVKRLNLVYDKTQDQKKVLGFLCADDSIREIPVIFSSVKGLVGTSIMDTRVIQIIATSEQEFLLSRQNKQETISSINLGGFAIPFNVPFDMSNYPIVEENTLFNFGTANSYPIITVAGPIGSFAILNQTTGDTFTYAGDLEAEEVLVLNSYNQTAIIDGITNDIANIPLSSDWIRLVPGENILRIIADEEAVAQVTWRDAYRGI